MVHNPKYGESSNLATEFNSNLYRLISLNKLLDDCNDFSRSCYLNGHNVEYIKLWNNTLKSVYREVRPKLSKKERKNIVDLFKGAKKIGKIFDIKKTPEGIVKILNISLFKRHWDLLDKIDGELRDLADKKGMLMTNKEDAGSSLK